jgi:hypothetical protein
MVRRIIVASAVGLGSLGGFALATSAAHASGACVTVDVNVNGQGTGGPQTVCTPAVPTLPTLPAPPALP